MRSDHDLAHEAMTAHIAASDTFTFQSLHAAGDAVTHHGFAYRPADRLLQKLRREGKIEQTEKRGVWKKVSQ